jgi:hypothetical protein
MTVAAPSQFAAEEDKPRYDEVLGCGEGFERGIGREFRQNCNTRYAQYRSFSKWRSDWLAAGPQDRDTGLGEAKDTWGANLHIPLSFRTIETLVPAAIAQRPRMLVVPRRQQWAANAPAVRLLIDAQQDQIDIDLPYQAQMRAGRIYGLGVGKVLWREEWATRRRAERHPFAGRLTGGSFQARYQPGEKGREKVFDDPDYEDVDPFDFMWDPYGYDLRTCGWVIHRAWRSLPYCLAMMRTGAWSTASVQNVLADGREEEHIRSMGARNRYDEVWADRMQASGFTSSNLTTGGEIHELWEWHDGERVNTVLDRSLLVVDGENPCCGTKPFTIYRPTPLQKQMVGIGDLEPLEHLQRELDTLRSQRRDAATIALAAGWAYDSAAVDEEDLLFRPNAAIEVRNASVRDALVPLQRPEVPAIGYREEEVIKADMDAVPGINEALNPASGPSAGTATEAFLVQASLSRRVELSSRRFEIEAVRQSARQFLHLDQRMILEHRELLLPGEGMTIEQAAEAGAWRKYDIGPAGLMGDFEFMPEGGSMAARNIPQDRQDAQAFFALAQSNPHVDGRRATLRALELMGVDDPAGWLQAQDQPIPPVTMELLGRMGVDPRIIRRAVQQAQAQDPRYAAGPNAQQVGQAMRPQPQEAPSPNGAPA